VTSMQESDAHSY